jgi:hypothetical protein
MLTYSDVCCRFVTTYAIIFKIHPELVIQQAANMPVLSLFALLVRKYKC